MDEKRNRLLIVDDDKMNLLALIEILQQDYQIYTAKDGDSAVKIATNFSPDLILLDILLPGMNGFEVFNELQKSEKNKEIPVIFITGLTSKAEEERGLNMGAADYITKPFNPSVIKLKVYHQIQIINLQRDLTDALRTAERANQAKSSFLAKMSHEIRTPLNVIMGMTENYLQPEYDLSPEVRDGFEKIYHSGDMLLSLVNDILDLSKIEAERLEITPGKYRVATLIHDAVHLNGTRFDHKSVEFKLSVEATLPAQLYGDELRIKQILNNLLSNSFKYTTSGSVSLSLSSEEMEEMDRVMLVLRVEDTGYGMTEMQVEHIFDEDSLFHFESNRKTQGAGLGMIISHNLTEMMDGTIEVKSLRGQGTVVIARLPQGRIGDKILGLEMAEDLQRFHFDRIRPKRKSTVTREQMPYGKVLIVDDMKTNLDVLNLLLAPYSMKVDAVENGAAAIDLIQKGNTYDVIFMDHMMPEMDGVETVKYIRQDGYSHPIIALTANAVAGQAEMFLANGFDSFLSKPVDIGKLNDVLNQWVKDRHM